MKTTDLMTVRADAHMRSLRRAEDQEPLPDVPVGTIPDDLRPYWKENDDRELRALVSWQDHNTGYTKDQRAAYLHAVRLRRAVDARAQAERKQEHAVAMQLASRCEVCAEPKLRVQLLDRESVTYVPEADQTVALPTYGQALRCCEVCRLVVPLRLAVALMSDPVGDRTRGDLADEAIRQRLGLNVQR